MAGPIAVKACDIKGDRYVVINNAVAGPGTFNSIGL